MNGNNDDSIQSKNKWQFNHAGIGAVFLKINRLVTDNKPDCKSTVDFEKLFTGHFPEKKYEEVQELLGTLYNECVSFRRKKSQAISSSVYKIPDAATAIQQAEVQDIPSTLSTEYVSFSSKKTQTISSSVYKTPDAAPTIQQTSQQASLMLVFGKSWQINIDTLNGVTEIDAMHREILKEYEWFWYGAPKQVPTLSDDDQGSMFWVQIDYSGELININQQVKTYLQVTDLLDRLVNKKLKLNPIKTGGPFNYKCLSQKGFLKA